MKSQDAVIMHAGRRVEKLLCGRERVTPWAENLLVGHVRLF